MSIKSLIRQSLLLLLIVSPVYAMNLNKMIDDLYQYGNGPNRDEYKKIFEDSLIQSTENMQKRLPIRLDKESLLVKANYSDDMFYYTVMLEKQSHINRSFYKSDKFQNEMKMLNRNNVCTNGIVRAMFDVFDVSALYIYMLTDGTNLFMQMVDKSTCSSIPRPRSN